MQSTLHGEAVRLSLPASPDFVRIVRLAASGIATNLGFDVDELDDLRVAVGELVNLTLEVCTPETLEVLFTIEGKELRVEGSAPAAEDRVVELDTLTRQILDAFLDGYAIEIADGRVRFSCTLRPG
ncbi:MAG: serine/threonine-protein kinase RsbW [Actinomycetota bacterium]|nr:serine/threonine-protein kinase RsbW [Actinomycetota bacterium]